jgi:Kdo2-lipid IVA lauroyltransferase/acyltransferase
MLKHIITHLPTKRLGRILGGLLYFCAISWRRIALNNLRFAFPEASWQWVRRIAWSVAQNYGTTLVEIVQMRFFSRDQILSRVKLHGLDQVLEQVSPQQGVVVVSAHMGNWEVGMQVMPCFFGRPLTAVAKKFKAGLVENWLHKTRTRFGSQILYKKGALAEMTRIIREGGVLTILVDMARRKDGVDIEFFGKKATATPAAAMLALRCRCPVVPVFCLREADGTIGIQIGAPIEMLRSRDLRRDLVVNTQRITDVVEGMVRQHPEQWHWVMKRWKDHYPELYEKR